MHDEFDIEGGGCLLCPRMCGVDRHAGERGVCGEGGQVRLARAALHHWEEPPVSGNAGSGTVFFSGCPLRCAYCQNASVAAGEVGRTVSVERLAEIFLEQQQRGALNINLVTPTHFIPQIVRALDLAKERGLVLPVVYNTSGYERPESLHELDGYVDVYLTDFKYASSELAARYSAAPDYPQVASRALDVMFAQVGAYTLGPDPRPGAIAQRCGKEDGILQRGVVVRHLLLPGQLRDSFAVMRHLVSKPYHGHVCVSLMSQYTPMPGVGCAYPELAQQVEREDYDALVDYALALGLENSFMQEGAAAQESFIPQFDYEGV